ncbi:2-C-methyl-D-erythritol 4-phosphate cytidylyltransferase [Leucothrix sargassi]|nr:2-C-methyl-D-erythritol 4-phosphate cytidylyltransferase [Leucothrix sargassi]
MSTINKSDVWVLVPAAGIGSRMQSEKPKQYLKLLGKTVLEHTLSRFTDLSDIAGILVVISEADQEWMDISGSKDFLSTLKCPLKFTYGGADRASTVLNGLEYMQDELELADDQWVMVHDAARPCVKEKDLRKLLDTRFCEGSIGGILAYPVKDTMKRSTTHEKIEKTVSRENLWHALTPQMFQLKALTQSLHAAKAAGFVVTDEASAMEFAGHSVQLVNASSDNIKLTSPDDLKLVEFLLNQFEVV